MKLRLLARKVRNMLRRAQAIIDLLQRTARSLGVGWFRLRGMRPWTKGYESYKRKEILSGIHGEFALEALPAGYGSRVDERVVEYPWFFSVLPDGEGRLLDAGSILNHDFIIDHPKLTPKKVCVSTLAPEHQAFWDHGVSYVYEDMRDLCYRDAFFDWVVCLSTLEHVGLDNTMLYTGDAAKNEKDEGGHIDAVLEMKRVLKPGGVLYLSVPFGQHQNHGWFQIFDAAMVDRLVEAFAPTSVVERIYRYTESGWCESDRDAAKDATYFDIHKQKKYDPDYAAASRAVVTLELTK